MRMFVCMSINVSFYLQTSNSLGLILRILTVILSLEGKDNASHGRAELMSHMCLYTSVLNCLNSWKGSRAFPATSVKPQDCNRIVTNLKFMFYREFVKLTFYLNSKLDRSYRTFFFFCNLYFKNILKDGNEIYKRLTATGKSGMTLFYHNLPVSLYFILFFSLYVITFFTI